MINVKDVSDRWENKKKICDIYNKKVSLNKGGFSSLDCQRLGATLLNTPINNVLDWASFLNSCKQWIAQSNSSEEESDYILVKNFKWWSPGFVLYWHNEGIQYQSPLLVKKDDSYWSFIYQCLINFNFFKNIDFKINDWKDRLEKYE